MSLWLIKFTVISVFIYHSLPKLRHPARLASGMGASRNFVFLLGLGEFGSSLLLLSKGFDWLGAAFLAFVMANAILFKKFKWHVPFSAQNATGWEFDFVLLASNLHIALSRFSGWIF